MKTRVIKMIVKQFKHVGKVYCLNIGDSFYTKCGSILKVENKTFVYISLIIGIK